MRNRPVDSNLCLTNTLTGKKEPFQPREDRKVRMFTCGPSIYRRPHIGNYRSFLYEDVLQRYLEYLGYRVKRVINFTDVEDKAIEEARERNLRLEELTQPIAERFLQDADLLGVKLPDFIPRSSTSVEQAVQLIGALLGKGYAYWHGKDVFYDPLKFEGFGKLFGLDMSRWPKKKRRFRKDTYPGQRWNLGDFILWHGSREEEENDYTWETRIGRGRPSWNIQDPAMITKHLGYELDVSCGGVDNLYRHHDYTIAVVEAVSGKELSRYWLHGEHVLVNGSKMSKSKENIVYPDDLVEEGYTGKHLRFYLIYGHYREKKDLTTKGLQDIVMKLDSFRAMLGKITEVDYAVRRSDSSAKRLIDGLTIGFEERMNDDLDVGGGFEGLYEKLFALSGLKMGKRLSDQDCERVESAMKRIDEVLQVL